MMVMAKVKVAAVCMVAVCTLVMCVLGIAAEDRTSSVTTAFGPVIERKIAFVSGKANSCLNLDSGLWVDAGRAASTAELRKIGAQLYRSAIQSNLNDLTALGVYLIPLEDGQWDKLSAGELVQQYQHEENSRRVSWGGRGILPAGDVPVLHRKQSGIAPGASSAGGWSVGRSGGALQIGAAGTISHSTKCGSQPVR